MARAREKGAPKKKPLRTCTGKRRFKNAGAANAAIERLARDCGTYAPHMRAYPCDHCGNYHIGHRAGLGRARKQR